MCGEGVPDFYAKQILADNKYCISKITDKFLGPAMKKFGICEDISTYNLRTDENGDPLIEDCERNTYSNYYLTK